MSAVERALPHSRPRLRALLPLYLSVWVVVTCALLAIGSVLAEARVVGLMVTLNTVGFAASMVLRLKGVARHALPLLLLGVGVGMAVLAQVRQFDILMPNAGAMVASILPALVLAWFLVIFSFCLIEDDLLLFVIPPSLAILGLSGTENPYGEVTAYFLIFVVASIFALSYQNYLRYVPAERVGRSPEALRPVLAWQLVTAAIIFALVAVFTAVVSLPLKNAGRMNAHRLTLPASDLLNTLPDLGYSAMGKEIRLGAGAPSLTDREVFRVESAQPKLWRTRTYDEYNGRGWRDNEEAMPVVVRMTRGGAAWQAVVEMRDPRAVAAQPGRKWLEQKITFVGSWPGQTLPAAADAFAVTLHSHPGTLRAARSGAVLLSTPQIQSGTSYEVTSRVLDVSPAELRRAEDANPDSPSLARYLRTPNSLWRVEAEAARITAGFTNNFDRASAIEEHLISHYVYNLDVPPIPPDEDVVTHFLFTAQEGYCDMFASAMTLMCRLANIPARMVTGFATGQYDPQSRSYVVRETDAHAWVEVFFPAYGWVSFDPTPAADEAPLQDVQKGGFSLVMRRLARELTFPAVLLVGVFALSLHLARLTLYDPWRRHRALLLSAGCDARGQVLGAYYCAYRRLQRHLPRRPHQTPMDYYHAVAGHTPAASWLGEWEMLSRLFTAARFGEAPVTEEQARSAREAAARLRNGLKQRPPR